jgi:hypothetical protein
MDLLGRFDSSGHFRFSRVLNVSRLLFVSLLAFGCSKKSESERPTPGAPASVSASPSATLAVQDPLKTAIPPFKLVRSFPAGTQHFKLTDGIVFCEDCVVETKRRKDPRPSYSYDGSTVTDLGDLLDDAKVSAAMGSSVTEVVRVTHGGEYIFAGSLSASLYLHLTGDWDDDNNPRTGSAWVRRWFKREGKTWKEVDEAGAPSIERPQLPNSLPRKFDDAMLHAPRLGGGEIPVIGGDGPLIVLEKRVVNLWDGKSFHEQPSSWTDQGAVTSLVRLATGYTLVVAASRLHVVGRDGKSQAYAWPPSTELPDTAELVLAQGHVALLGQYQKQIRLYQFEGNEPLGVPPVAREKLEKAEPQTNPKTTAADAGTIDASTKAQKPATMPAMVKWTEQCQHPFVILFTPPSSNWGYRTFASNLKGHDELQDHLTFVEFVRNGVVYFGAQADTEANARALMNAYKERVPKAKPSMGCLDANGYLPNRDVAQPDAHVVSINLTAGIEL